MKKEILSLLLASTLAFGLVGCSDESSTTPSSSNTPSNTPASTTPTDTEVPESVEEEILETEEVAELTETEKEAIKQVDADIFLIIEQAETYFYLLNDGINMVADGQGTMLELYQLAQSVYDRQEECYKLLALYKSDYDFNHLKNSAMTYVRNFSEASEILMDFVDTGSTASQAKFLEYNEMINPLVTDYTIKRMEFLLEQGFEEEEVWETLGTEE
ncbi:MAG: hypothetical protein R3Y63_08700 [Eubacteriales bacterium]